MEDRAQRNRRRSIRLQEYDYSWAGWYYVTICAKGGICLFGDIVEGKVCLSQWGKLVREEWLKTPEVRKTVELDEFVVMPNHLHGIIIMGESVGATRRVAQEEGTAQPLRATLQVAPTKTLVSGSLGAIIGQFKSMSAKRINKIRGTKGSSMWQRNYYEHIIRDDADLHRIRTYIQNNPLQWELDEENPRNYRAEQSKVRRAGV